MRLNGTNMTTPKEEEIRKEFGEMFAYAYPHKQWTESGTDEIADYWLRIRREAIAEEKERVRIECERMYPEFLQRDCNDLLVILSGRLQIPHLTQE